METDIDEIVDNEVIVEEEELEKETLLVQTISVILENAIASIREMMEEAIRTIREDRAMFSLQEQTIESEEGINF